MDPKDLKAEHMKRISQAGVESRNERRKYLATIPIEYPVENASQARDPRLIEWATQKIIGGMELDELRARMGLVANDPRWLAVRKQLIHNQIPTSNEEALVEQYVHHQDLLEQLQSFLKEVDAKIDNPGTSEEEQKAEPQYYKLKLETLKSIIEHHSDKFSQYMDIQRLKVAQKSSKKLGVQIVINNKIPRPSPVRALASGEVETIEHDDE